MIAMRSSALLVCLIWSACAGTEPADPRVVAAETRRLLAPYLAGQRIGCDELRIEMTANFSTHVSRPAVDPVRHRFVRRKGDGFDELEWLNLGADPAAAFTVIVSEADLEAEIASGRPGPRQGTTFTVVRAVRMKVFTGRELTLGARATGDVFVLAGAETRELREFEIRDGVLRSR
jgi:hypothetical protein